LPEHLLLLRIVLVIINRRKGSKKGVEKVLPIKKGFKHVAILADESAHKIREVC
jgi:hypothetical protein